MTIGPEDKLAADILEAEKLAKWINRRPYVAISGETHIDGEWMKLAVYVPMDYKRGIPLLCQIIRLFIKSCWRSLL